MSDVIVVGAGIGGAVLAWALGRRGWKVKVLEREARPIPMARPEILWGTTISALGQLGLADFVTSQASVRLDGVEVTRGNRRLLAITQEVLQRAEVEAWSTDPGQTRELIAHAAVSTGNVTLMRGAAVQEVVFERNRVVGVRGQQQGAPIVEQARLVVGDDGAKSVVRAAITDIRLNLFPLEFIVAPLETWPGDLRGDRVRVWLNPQAFRSGIPALGCFPWPGHRGVVLLPMPAARAAATWDLPAEAFWAELSRLTPIAAALREQLKFPESFRRVERPYGHAPHYVADGAAIMGDAAHPMSPAGGQGANASIWDALALAEVADEALKADDTSRQRLARYEALRRPRNADSVGITERAVRVFRAAGHIPGLQWLVPALLRSFDPFTYLKSRLMSTVSHTFVTH